LSEKLFKFLLSELSTIRVQCRKCKGTAEVSLENLTRAVREDPGQDCICPFCKESFYTSDKRGGPLHALVYAINTLAGYSEKIEIQFVLKDEAQRI
jgi:hypothetical protein